jgi:hypothetical protein
MEWIRQCAQNTDLESSSQAPSNTSYIKATAYPYDYAYHTAT